MTISCRLIAEGVCHAYGIKLADLYSRRRDRVNLRPRHMGWTLAKHLTSRPVSQIGRMMGGYDHTSVLYGIRKIEAAIETDASVSADYNNLADALLALARPRAVDGFEFRDIDPTEAAYAILSTPFGTIAPSLDEIRALAMGVLHYEAELGALLADPQASVPAPTRYILAQRPANAELKRSGRAVIQTWQALHEATFSGTGTINARRAFADALKTLQISIERTEE
jgi:hypothetical protein